MKILKRLKNFNLYSHRSQHVFFCNDTETWFCPSLELYNYKDKIKIENEIDNILIDSFFIF